LWSQQSCHCQSWCFYGKTWMLTPRD
jgi:hypothetical protein